MGTKLRLHPSLIFLWYFRICKDPMSYVDLHLASQPVQKDFYTRYRVLFYLCQIEPTLKRNNWYLFNLFVLIEPAIKRSKAPKYDQDCSIQY